MEEPKKSNLWLIILCVFAFLIICMGAVFNNRFEKEHGDITAKNDVKEEKVEEVKEEVKEEKKEEKHVEDEVKEEVKNEKTE